MLFVVDVGNTHTVLGLYEGAELRHHWRLRTDPERTTDEWGLSLHTLFHLVGLDLAVVKAVAVSSVVPPAVHVIRRASQRYFGVEPLVVGPGVKTGLAIRYDNPREVGADRIVNAVAAYSVVQGPCIVVDFGTATTFDCISGSGEYLGGAIVPGIGIALDALVTRAAKLPRVEIARPRNVIGRNTEESMQSGILFGYVSLVDGLVDRLAAQMGGQARVIATGGLAGAIASESRTIESVSPNLTLDGLRLIHERNAG
ncbi:MAG: type III pantothenate kinase [Deltaproteobacteria bacterium]|nr:type III pantothenate kinase [Deltaproteobacteria bacterium]